MGEVEIEQLSLEEYVRRKECREVGERGLGIEAGAGAYGANFIDRRKLLSPFPFFLSIPEHRLLI